MPDAQKPDVDSRVIVLVGVALIAVIVLAAVTAWLMWQVWNPSRPDDGPNASLDFSIAAPRLESSPQADLRAYLADKDRLLHTWQWIDRDRGIARIPINEAMELAARPPATSAPAGKQRRQR